MRRIIFGANDNTYDAWVQNAPSPTGTNGERRYFDGINHVPVDWTSMRCRTPHAIISLRLIPADLLSGKEVADNGSGWTTLARQVQHLIGTMPDGAWLTMWHEASPGNNLDYPPYIYPGALKAAHAFMQVICHDTPNAENGRTGYCQIMIGPVWNERQWVAPGLDAYGIDIYDNRRYWNLLGRLSARKLWARMDDDRLALTAINGRSPILHIPETNSPRDMHRRKWFSTLAQWMALNNGEMMISHWHPGGKDSGPWPPSAPVLAMFRELQRLYGR